MNPVHVAVCGLALVTSTVGAQPHALRDHDFECLSRVARASPVALLALANLAGQCRVAPTAAVATWLWRSPQLVDLTEAFAARLGATGRSVPAPVPAASPAFCAQLAALPEQRYCGAGAEG